MIIYLYIKTHNKTGLKYLGKTISKNPCKYPGSGKTWREHLKIYGNDCTTIIIKECYNNSELSYWGRHYSKVFRVTTSVDDYGNRIWANRIPETGGSDGSALRGKPSPLKGKKRPPEVGQKVKQNHRTKKPGYTPVKLGDKHYMRNPAVAERYKGDNNYQTKPDFKYNSMVFTWRNIKTGQIVTMKHIEFYRKFNLRSSNVVRALKGKTKTVGGWELISE